MTLSGRSIRGADLPTIRYACGQVRHVAIQQLPVVAHDLAIGEAPAVRRRYHAVLDRNCRRIDVQALRCRCNKRRARECARRSQR